MSLSGRRSGVRRALGGGMAAAALTLGGFQALPAAAAPTASAAADPGARTAACDDGGDQGPRCVAVKTALDAAPAKGGATTLTVKVDPRIDIPGAKVEIDLPAALRFSDAPDGFAIDRRADALPGDGGSVSRATRTLDLRADRTLTFTAPVTAAATGDLTVRTRVLPPEGYGAGVEDPALLTVGTDAAHSRLGLASGTYTAAKAPAGTKVKPLMGRPTAKIPAEGLAKPHTDDPGAAATLSAAGALTCVRGSFFYNDEDGVARSSANLQVQVWDEDPANSDDLLTVGLTDGNGAFRLCFDNGTDALGGQDLYLKFVTQNGQWGVERDDDDVYEFRTPNFEDRGDGTTSNLGSYTAADARLQGALRAYDFANTAAEWTPGDCWDERDWDCRRTDINWHPDDDPGGAFYRPSEDEIYLPPQDADDRNVVVHEIGHAVMDDTYEEDDFDTHCPSPHYITNTSSTNCAWSEGFADWYGVAVFGDPLYVDRTDTNNDASGFTVDFDKHTWDTGGWDDGDAVEGRVAGALWDLVDSGTEGWDAYGEGLAPVWNTFLDHRATTFREYWDARVADGRETGAPALGSLFQNTIDYGYRNPLTNHQSQTRPTPDPAHNYRFDTTKVFWSVVALRPPAGADYDLRLYDDQAQNDLLGASVAGTGVTDFVAINSNVRPTGDYYPRVTQVSGTGDYGVEADETEGVFAGSPTVTMGADRLAAVWDLCLPEAEKATYTVTPSGTDQDAELFVVDTTQGGGDNVVSRLGATAAGDTAGAGAPESVTVDLPSGCHGLVLVNKAGSGTYTLTKS
ncbi:hypothetical protein [Streptomyces sp. VRA16 Mangrove soil]|uniref:hypothetical protein n=1 Tax=Streptomyces sp. VRA16 Mangrove soil TaxID=2817434 RepID=UPI001A9ED4A8|nr:hypothetical protein [Streptomyces sp. VRA16 Mangrove soil]MBO1330129.1 hypothetical protein [Streptomyces sp. VRA16 Mangrove soil]